MLKYYKNMVINIAISMILFEKFQELLIYK